MVCFECLSSLTPVTAEQIEQEFNRKFSASGIIEEFFPLYVFEKGETIQNLLHNLKYNNGFGVGKFLGIQIAQAYEDNFRRFNPDFILPVPLHKLKKAERGYNQSYWLARGIASVLQIKIVQKAVKRAKYTESQTTFNKNERSENISGAFIVKKDEKIRGAKIIIIDDVVTTGSTALELAVNLKKAGAEKILLTSAAVPLIDD